MLYTYITVIRIRSPQKPQYFTWTKFSFCHISNNFTSKIVFIIFYD